MKITENSSVYLIYNIYSNISNAIEEGNLYFEKSTAQIFACKLVFIKTTLERGNCISSYNSEISINDTIFKDFSRNCLLSIESWLDIKFCRFENSKNGENLKSIKNSSNFKNIMNFGTVYCFDCSYINIEKSQFLYNMYADFGAAIFIESSKIIPNELEGGIRNSIFEGNLAGENGIVYIFNQNISIINCIFANNEAKRGAGLFLDNNGILYKLIIFEYFLIFIDKTITLTTVYFNIFVNNLAYLEGGAIKWAHSIPIFSNNTYSNNTAIYGSNIASFPSKIALIVHLKEDIIFNSSKDPKPMVFPNISSGVEIPYTVEFLMMDYYDEIVAVDFSY